MIVISLETKQGIKYSVEDTEEYVVACLYPITLNADKWGFFQTDNKKKAQGIFSRLCNHMPCVKLFKEGKLLYEKEITDSSNRL